MKIFFRIVLLFLFLFGGPFLSVGQVMTDYCQLPASLNEPLAPNVLFLIDTSLSMSYCAYTSKTDAGATCVSTTAGETFDAAKSYEGYFDQTKNYTLNGSGVYVESSAGTCVEACVDYTCRNNWLGGCNTTKGDNSLCSGKYYCCWNKQYTGGCGGKYLNYLYMRRIDVLRWALTGGKPDTCTSETDTRCNPGAYYDAKPDQLTCDAYGCIMQAYDGTKVKVHWSRITGINPNDGEPYSTLHEVPVGSGTFVYDADDTDPLTGNRWVVNPGLLFQLKESLTTKPYVGAMFFQDTGIVKTIYIGDFTASNDTDSVNPFKNTITSMNFQEPAGFTPTAPALWDAYHYFAQENPQYGGPTPDKKVGAGNPYKNPMFRCFDTDNSGACGPTEYVSFPCAKNYIILLTDGNWNRGGSAVVNRCQIDEQTSWATNSPDPVVPAYKMHKIGFTNAMTDKKTYIESVYTIGLWLGGNGEQSLKNVAMYGSFDRTKDWPGNTTNYPSGSCGPVTDCCCVGGLFPCPTIPASSNTDCGKGSACTATPASSPDWDSKNNVTGANTPDNIPDTFFGADNAEKIKEQLAKVMEEILRRVSSGSAVSILSSSEGSGANLLQAVYYPRKSYGTIDIDWIGAMQNLWYYVDPFLSTSSVREDTNATDPANADILNLEKDYVLELFFDTLDGKTKAKRYTTDAKGNNKSASPVDTILLENINNLWEAGTVLFERTSSSPNWPRTIYTSIDGSSFLTDNFSTTNASTLRPYLHLTTNTDAEATKLINYIHGTDQPGYRSRTITIPTSSLGATPGVWKLGDIVNSSPIMQASAPLNSFHKLPPDGYSDTTYRAFTQTSDYLNRNMSYIGANDGMLHAFKHGKLVQAWSGKTDANDQAKLTNLGTTPLGSEAWTYVPKNSLPYLQYLADPKYCHLFYVDAANTVFEASIKNTALPADPDYSDDTKTMESWQTILIGGMGLGGASKMTGSTGAAGTCVLTPTTDPGKTPAEGLGYSSYFALNVTNPNSPSLLWEFSHPDLGFSTTGPAIVRIGSASKNGKWFAVFASGPTGPIDTANRQFLGKSNQTLKLFVLDLKTGQLATTAPIDTGIANAFGGSLYNATVDTDRATVKAGSYSDDAFYLGYTECADAGVLCTPASTWTKGGVIRVITKEDPNPANWEWSYVIKDIGPVTSAVTKLQDTLKENLWLYFGTGRFYYRLGAGVDDASTRRAIYGVREPCYNTLSGPKNDIYNSCDTSTPLTIGNLNNRTSNTLTSSDPLTSTAQGWYINLAEASGDIGAERVITDPFAAGLGAVFYTTYTPSIDPCAEGGNTNIWAVSYDLGAAVSLQGMAITQVSTGAIHELNLGTAFDQAGGRKTSNIIGMPPKGQGLSLLVGPRPVRKILHMKEK